MPLLQQHQFFGAVTLLTAQACEVRAARKRRPGRVVALIADTGRGPRIPAMDDPKFSETIEDAAEIVLSKSGPGISVYTGSLVHLQNYFPWYRYLFLNRSKPSTHLMAISQITDEELVAKGPDTLKRLLKKVSNDLQSNTILL